MAVRVGRVEIVDVPGRDERQLLRGGEPRERLERCLLHLETDVLELDVGVVAAEDLREPVELRGGVAIPVLGERARDTSGEAPRERDHTGRVAPEELPVDTRLVVVALEVPERAELDQVAVARVVGCQQREVRVALRLRPSIVDDVDLAAEDRLDALVARRLVELDRARHRAVVGERHGRHLELGRLCGQRRDPARPVEDRVLGVDVEVDELGGHGRAMLIGRPEVPRTSRDARCGLVRKVLDKRADRVDNEIMRQLPTSLKLLAVVSLIAEATAAALVFWHTGPRTR